MTRITTLAFCATIAAMALSASVAQADCQAVMPHLKIKLTEQETTFETGKSISTLSKQSGPRRADLKQFDHTLGITKPEFSEEYKYLPFVSKSKDKICVGTRELLSTVTMHQIVDVASQLKRGSCGYNLVHGHEMKHVRVNSAFFRNYDRYLIKAFEDSGPYVGEGKTKEEANAKLNKKLSEALHNGVLAFANAVKSKQEQIDTPYEYTRINRTCGEDFVDHILSAK